jgi:AraC-like DNA-binding protein
MSHEHCCFAPAPFGRLHHPRGERLTRHCHAQPFAAVVLSGRYEEAGDQGRHAVAPGDVLIHTAFEAHLNRFGGMGADVLLLPLPVGQSGPQSVYGVHADPDLLARVAERDPVEATALLMEGFRGTPPSREDWPDILAARLRREPHLSLGEWARSMALRAETVSRGFKAAYGVSPAAYRATARARAAYAAIQVAHASLAEVAANEGFADQAHMTRAVRQLTGRSPGYWRRLA